MLKLVRFRILSLLIVTLLVAIGLAVVRPFSPHIIFGAITASFDTVESGRVVPCCDLPVTNNGILPVWLTASATARATYMYSHGYSRHDVHSTAILCATSNYWIRLDSGQSAILKLPETSYTGESLVGILMSDWRGRTSEAWSYPFIPAELPQNGG